jgi:microcystin-dependent protein
VMMNDGSIGSAASGATTRANADTQALYTLLWTNISNTWAPVSGGRGASAAADFSANKTLTLPKALGRALSVAGAGSGLTSRALGQNLGEETHLLTGAESGTAAHGHSASGSVGYSQAGGGATTFIVGGTDGQGVDGLFKSVSVTVNNSASSSAASAHNNMQPSAFFNVMVKL